MCCPDVRLQIGRPRVLLGTPFPSAWELRPVLIVESFVRFQLVRSGKRRGKKKRKKKKGKKKKGTCKPSRGINNPTKIVKNIRGASGYVTFFKLTVLP